MNIPIKMTMVNAIPVNAVSPVVSMERTAGDDGILLTIEDINGVHTITINDGDIGPQGEQGEQGEQGNGISSVALNSDYTLTLTFTDGTTYTTASIRGEQGPQGEQGERGATGATGNGIRSILLNNDYTLTINYTNGNSDTTPSIRGEQGVGIRNITMMNDCLYIALSDGTVYQSGSIRGVGIEYIGLKSDDTLGIRMTDGTTYVVGPIRGPQGETGNGIASTVLNNDYTLTLTYTDGTTYTTPSIRGEKGESADSGTRGAVFGRKFIPCEDGEKKDENIDYRKVGNCLLMNGYYGTTGQRMSIYGEFEYNGGQPSYARLPGWYHDPCSQFTIGHTYYLGYKIVSGTVTRGTEDKDFYYDLRAAEQDTGSITIGEGKNWLWTCTFVPEMIAFVGRDYTYDNAVIELLIYDITEMTGNPAVTTLWDKLSSAGDAYGVPDYFEEQLEDVIEAVNADLNGTRTATGASVRDDFDAFVFITDPHWGNNKKNSPGLIRRILDQTPIKTVICGGDIVADHKSTKEAAVAELREFTELMAGLPCYDYYAAVGNHDDNSNSQGSAYNLHLSKREIFNVMYGPFANRANVHWAWQDEAEIDDLIDSDYPVRGDYYFDHDRSKTRYICVDWNNPFSDPRGKWLQSILARNDGYRVIVIHHGIYSKSGSGEDAGTVPVYSNAATYDVGDYVMYTDPNDTDEDKTNVIWVCATAVTEAEEFDSSKWTKKLIADHAGMMDYIAPYRGKVAAVISGHTHMDAVIDWYQDGSVPVIITSCDEYRDGEGTTDEQCFDVVVVDYNESKIKMTRVGRGSDREISISVTSAESGAGSWTGYSQYGMQSGSVKVTKTGNQATLHGGRTSTTYGLVNLSQDTASIVAGQTQPTAAYTCRDDLVLEAGKTYMLRMRFSGGAIKLDDGQTSSRTQVFGVATYDGSTMTARTIKSVTMRALTDENTGDTYGETIAAAAIGEGSIMLTPTTDLTYGFYMIERGATIYDGLSVEWDVTDLTGVNPAAAFYGLAKAAGDTTQASSGNAVGTYTENAISKIHDMLAAPFAVSGTTPTITAKSGVRYVCGEVSTITITPPASGVCDVVFESGSTPAVLTATGVTWPAWFDPNDLEADCVYEINILDGRGTVGVWS